MNTDLTSLPTPVGLTDTGDLRVIVEHSSMINNDQSYHRIAPAALQSFEDKVHNLKWRVRVVRPFFQEEQETGANRQGLPYTYTDEDLWPNRDAPPAVVHLPLTDALDALYTLRRQLEFWVMKMNRPLEETLIHDLAYQYYDCMSGGCSIYALLVYAKFFEFLDVSKDTEIYPGKKLPDGTERWHTVGDFLDEMSKKQPVAFPFLLSEKKPV